jgi:hypothetical protein
LKIKKSEISQVQWLTFVIPATQEVTIMRLTAGSQPRQKVGEIPLQPIKVGSGGTHYEILGPGRLGQKSETLLEK